MKKLLIIGGAAALGYWLLKDQISAVLSPAQPEAPATPPTTFSGTKEQVRLLAGGPGPRSVDDWNFYYHLTPQGIAAPAPASDLPGIAPGQLVNIDQWWAALETAYGGTLGRLAW